MLNNNQLSYIDALYLLSQAKKLVPGLKKVLGFYYDSFEKRIASSILESQKKGIEELDLENEFDLRQIMKSRNEKQATSWLSESDLPFLLKTNHHIQSQVFSELDNTIILLRFPNKDDGKMDLIYLFINADASNFGLRTESDILNTENKSIIGHLIYNSFKQILDQRSNFIKENSQLKNHYSLIQKKIEIQKQEYKQQQQDSHKQKLNYCQYIIDKVSINLGIHIEMGLELKELLGKYNGTIQSMEVLVIDAIERANDTNINILSPILTLEEWHFDNLDQDIFEAASLPEELGTDSRHVRTFAILDRYEESARKLLSNREKLTGANVGKALPNPISAAAVTDSIKKHQNKINTLCKQYPNRWKIIRNEFRPLMNVLHA